ncbi:MAG: sulfur carrier protein ThiS [Spirochaetes bacterium]|nr:sulfur carrier protein ThiS [Spirochaetota bacterium]
MQITVNGKVIRFDTHPDAVSVDFLLKHLKIKGRNVAVEKNGIIIDKTEYGKEQLNAGDVVEIVQFVGGG